MKKLFTVLLAICGVSYCLVAQSPDTTKHKKFHVINNGRFYGSWGYNMEWYTHSNITVDQPQLNNDFAYEDLSAHDRIGWNNLFHVQPTIPQYNYRIGYFFDEKQLWGIEISFDHTKYVVYQGNNAEVKGTLNGRQVDTTILINQSTLYWQLNNGANWFDLNITRKLPIYSTSDNKFVLYALVKAGTGPNVPHVDDVIFGHQNIDHFQYGGWNVGTEALIRATFFQYAFVEFSNKLIYAWYYGLQVYGGSATVNNGWAQQSFGSYEWIANIGFTFHLGKTEGTNTAR
jgi:hypothetical protein